MKLKYEAPKVYGPMDLVTLNANLESKGQGKLTLKEILGTKGWVFVGNEDSFARYNEDVTISRFSPPRSDFQIKADYEKIISGREILVTDAHDANGNPIKEYRAVYIKEEPFNTQLEKVLSSISPEIMKDIKGKALQHLEKSKPGNPEHIESRLKFR